MTISAAGNGEKQVGDLSFFTKREKLTKQNLPLAIFTLWACSCQQFIVPNLLAEGAACKRGWVGSQSQWSVLLLFLICKDSCSLCDQGSAVVASVLMCSCCCCCSCCLCAEIGAHVGAKCFLAGGFNKFFVSGEALAHLRGALGVLKLGHRDQI